jgi:hypothetical protein
MSEVEKFGDTSDDVAESVTLFNKSSWEGATRYPDGSPEVPASEVYFISLQLASNCTRTRLRERQSSGFSDHLQSLNHLLIFIPPSNQLQRNWRINISLRSICSRNQSQ